MEVWIDGQTFVFTNQIRNSSALRKSFNALTKETFGFDFVSYYEDGFWGDGYLPHVLIDRGRVVSNVSVNLTPISILGEERFYVQLGTVMTAKEYRNRGLARFLMEQILFDFKEKCDQIYLFANDSALAFYPKFGFVPVQEYQYERKTGSAAGYLQMRRLDIGRETDRHLIEQKAKEGNPFAALSSAQYNLVYFYASYFDRGNFWFLEKEELLAVVEEAEDHLRIKEILGDTDRPLTEIVDRLADRCGRRIVLGFTPKDTVEWTSVPLHEADSNLFLFKEKENPFLHHRLKFPDLSHA